MATRWLATLACAAAILGFVAPAYADDRLTIAILGLEVVGGVADPRQTAVAHDITEGLRIRARIGQGYAYAPSSERELIDEKLIKSCDSERPLCMSLIAKDIGADVLVYGKLDKAANGYRLVLQLLDAGKPAKLNRISVTAPLDIDSDGARALAKKFYDELIGKRADVGAMGSVAVTANIDDGTVYVDDGSATSLRGGKATIELPEGRYRIAVEAPGKQRKEIQVTVKAKGKVSQTFDLVARGSGESSRSSERSGIWKPALIISASLTGVLGTYTVYLLASWHGKVSEIDATKVDDPATPDDESKQKITASDCDGPRIGKNIVADRGGTLGDICQQRDTQSTMAWLTAGVGVVAVVSGVMYFRSRRSNEHAGVAVLPVVSRDGGGAVVELRW